MFVFVEFFRSILVMTFQRFSCPTFYQTVCGVVFLYTVVTNPNHCTTTHCTRIMYISTPIHTSTHSVDEKKK